jgi:hypothetical protein
VLAEHLAYWLDEDIGRDCLSSDLWLHLTCVIILIWSSLASNSKFSETLNDTSMPPLCRKGLDDLCYNENVLQ